MQQPTGHIASFAQETNLVRDILTSEILIAHARATAACAQGLSAMIPEKPITAQLYYAGRARKFCPRCLFENPEVRRRAQRKSYG